MLLSLQLLAQCAHTEVFNTRMNGRNDVIFLLAHGNALV